MIEKVNHPNVKLMLDVFHLQYLKGDLGNSIKKYLPITGGIQTFDSGIIRIDLFTS